MSEKKHQKSIEELCRSRLPRTAGSEMWPLPQTATGSNHRLFRSPSPRESFSRSRRRSGNARHHLLMPSSLSTEFIPGGAVQVTAHEAASEKRKTYQNSHEAIKKPLFPGLHPQVVTHADPPFAGTDTQPLPPINMPKGQESSSAFKQSKDNRPFTIYGQTPFDNGAAFDITFGGEEERAGKRKLEAIKRPDEANDWHAISVSRQQKDGEQRGKKKCGRGKKKGKKARRFTKPLAWKSPWPNQGQGVDSDTDAEWTDIN